MEIIKNNIMLLKKFLIYQKNNFILSFERIKDTTAACNLCIYHRRYLCGLRNKNLNPNDFMCSIDIYIHNYNYHYSYVAKKDTIL